MVLFSLIPFLITGPFLSDLSISIFNILFFNILHKTRKTFPTLKINIFIFL